MDPTQTGTSQITFEQATRTEPQGPGTAQAELSPAWTVNGRPHGGYLLALLARAATRPAHLPHVLAASCHFLRSPKPGPTHIRTELIREGRTVGHIRSALLQNGQTCVEALLTVGRLTDADPSHQLVHELLVDDGSSLHKATRITTDPNVFPVALFDHVDARLDPDCAGVLDGRPTGKGELRGWLSLPDNEPFGPDSLLFAVDAFPPATFDIEFSGWVPTLQLSAYIRAQPAPGPLRIHQRARLIQGDRVDQTCLVWDQRGRLVAQATQLAAFIRL